MRGFSNTVGSFDCVLSGHVHGYSSNSQCGNFLLFGHFDLESWFDLGAVHKPLDVRFRFSNNLCDQCQVLLDFNVLKILRFLYIRLLQAFCCKLNINTLHKIERFFFGEVRRPETYSFLENFDKFRNLSLLFWLLRWFFW